MRKFLVTGLIKSKEGKLYLKGFYWNAEKNKWSESKQKDGSWGASLIEVSAEDYNYASQNLASGLVLDTEVTGYTANDMPIRSIVR